MASTSTLKSRRKTIEEPMEKHEIWAFIDIKCQVDKKIDFKWSNLFQAFQKKEFQVLLQDDPSMKLSKGIYKNISKSGIHRPTAKTPILSYPDVIEWMIRKIGHESRTILNFKDKHVASYQAPILNQLYHFKEARVKVTLEWLKNKTESVNFLSIMKGWWSEGQFRSKPSPVEQITSKFKKSIQIIVILMERIFGSKDASSFLDKWIPIIH